MAWGDPGSDLDAANAAADAAAAAGGGWGGAPGPAGTGYGGGSYGGLSVGSGGYSGPSSIGGAYDGGPIGGAAVGGPAMGGPVGGAAVGGPAMGTASPAATAGPVGPSIGAAAAPGVGAGLSAGPAYGGGIASAIGPSMDAGLGASVYGGAGLDAPSSFGPSSATGGAVGGPAMGGPGGYGGYDPGQAAAAAYSGGGAMALQGGGQTGNYPDAGVVNTKDPMLGGAAPGWTTGAPWGGSLYPGGPYETQWSSPLERGEISPWVGGPMVPEARTALAGLAPNPRPGWTTPTEGVSPLGFLSERPVLAQQGLPPATEEQPADVTNPFGPSAWSAAAQPLGRSMLANIATGGAVGGPAMGSPLAGYGGYNPAEAAAAAYSGAYPGLTAEQKGILSNIPSGLSFEGPQQPMGPPQPTSGQYLANRQQTLDQSGLARNPFDVSQGLLSPQPGATASLTDQPVSATAPVGPDYSGYSAANPAISGLRGPLGPLGQPPMSLAENLARSVQARQQAPTAIANPDIAFAREFIGPTTPEWQAAHPELTQTLNRMPQTLPGYAQMTLGAPGAPPTTDPRDPAYIDPTAAPRDPAYAQSLVDYAQATRNPAGMFSIRGATEQTRDQLNTATPGILSASATTGWDPRTIIGQAMQEAGPALSSSRALEQNSLFGLDVPSDASPGRTYPSLSAGLADWAHQIMSPTRPAWNAVGRQPTVATQAQAFETPDNIFKASAKNWADSMRTDPGKYSAHMTNFAGRVGVPNPAIGPGMVAAPTAATIGRPQGVNPFARTALGEGPVTLAGRLTTTRNYTAPQVTDPGTNVPSVTDTPTGIPAVPSRGDYRSVPGQTLSPAPTGTGQPVDPITGQPVPGTPAQQVQPPGLLGPNPASTLNPMAMPDRPTTIQPAQPSIRDILSPNFDIQSPIQPPGSVIQQPAATPIPGMTGQPTGQQVQPQPGQPAPTGLLGPTPDQTTNPAAVPTGTPMRPAQIDPWSQSLSPMGPYQRQFQQPVDPNTGMPAASPPGLLGVGVQPGLSSPALPVGQFPVDLQPGLSAPLNLNPLATGPAPSFASDPAAAARRGLAPPGTALPGETQTTEALPNISRPVQPTTPQPTPAIRPDQMVPDQSPAIAPTPQVTERITQPKPGQRTLTQSDLERLTQPGLSAPGLPGGLLGARGSGQWPTNIEPAAAAGGGFAGGGGPSTGSGKAAAEQKKKSPAKRIDDVLSAGGGATPAAASDRQVNKGGGPPHRRIPPPGGAGGGPSTGSGGDGPSGSTNMLPGSQITGHPIGNGLWMSPSGQVFRPNVGGGPDAGGGGGGGGGAGSGNEPLTLGGTGKPWWQSTKGQGKDPFLTLGGTGKPWWQSPPPRRRKRFPGFPVNQNQPRGLLS